MKTVSVDLNAITKEGWIRTRISNFNDRPEVGEHCFIYQLEDDILGLAEIMEINENTGLVYLKVFWETLDDKR